MNAYKFILSKQIQWAKNNGITLIGSKGDRGLPAYTQTMDENLFEPLSRETLKAFKEGDGGELAGNPAKMQAVHSSSALSVNIFQYWQSTGQPEKIAHACRFCQKTTKISKSIHFDSKYPISDHLGIGPNLDVVIENETSAKYQVFAIECKFSEAYGGRRHGGIKEKYLALNIWEDIPNLHKLAISISPNDDETRYLHRAQLIKHILGLKRAYGKTRFRLLYLWYDAFGSEGGEHREEIANFIQVASSDEIRIHGLSYQELIVWLAENFREPDADYVKYITNRYL